MATDAETLEDGEGQAPAKGGKSWILIIVSLLVLGGGGFGAWKYFAAKGEAKKVVVELKIPPRYVTLDPPFVVNFESQSMVRFLQVTVGIMTRDLAVETMVKDNDPRVRNDLLMILGNQTYESVSTTEGKEALRTRCLESVRTIVKEMGGDPKKVEALYFTAFVMQ